MLGSSLCQLYNKIHKVYGLHRDKQFYSTCHSNFKLDLTDNKKLRECIQKVNPQIIIHCAGLTNVDECEKNPILAYQANVKVCENIARICENKIKLVYISTDQVYGNTPDRTEKNKKLIPLNEYGKTKLNGEKKIANICNQYLIIRTNIFWWNSKPRRVSFAEWLFSSLINKNNITLFSDYLFTPISTIYLGSLILDLIELNYTGIINVGSYKACSKYDFGLAMADEYGLDSSCINKGLISDHSFSAIRSKNLILDVNKLINMKLSVPSYCDSIKQFLQYRIDEHNS